MSKNDITGDNIQTKVVSDSYRSNWDSIFSNSVAKELGCLHNWQHVEQLDDNALFRCSLCGVEKWQ